MLWLLCQCILSSAQLESSFIKTLKHKSFWKDFLLPFKSSTCPKLGCKFLPCFLRDFFFIASVNPQSNLLIFRRRGCEEEAQLCELVTYSGKIRFVLLEIVPLLTKN